MTDHPDVDLPALRAALAPAIDGRIEDVSVLNDGVNLLLAVTTPTDRYVLRRPTSLRDAPYMLALEDEYAVLEWVAETPVPTPAPVAFVADETALGGPFYAMTHVAGDPVPLGSDLPERFRTDRARAAVASGLIAALSAVHAVPVAQFEAALDRVTPGAMVERTLDRAVTVTAETGRDDERLRAVAERLRERAPTDPGTTLAHGDFRPGNVLFVGRDRPRVSAVLDWETALLGDPLTDLGYFLLRWRDDGDPTPDLAPIAERYDDPDALAELRRANRHGLAPFSSAPGSPSREALVDQYERRTGRSVGDLGFYLGLAAFGLATVWEDLHRRRLAAGEPSEFPSHADYALALAELALDGAFDG